MADSAAVLNVVGTSLESVAVVSAATQAYLFGFPAPKAVWESDEMSRGEKLASWLAKRAEDRRKAAEFQRRYWWVRHVAYGTGILVFAVAAAIVSAVTEPFGGNNIALMVFLGICFGTLGLYQDLLIDSGMARVLLIVSRHLGVALAGASLVFGVGVILQLVAASIAL